MAIATIHKLDKIVFPSAAEVIACQNARWDAGIESMLERPSGHPDPMFVATRRQRPSLSFSTSQLDVVLALLGFSGLSTTTAINTYFKLATVTGSVARATLGHKRIAIQDACVYWTSIRLPHNGSGEVDVIIQTAYDGTNEPFVYTGSIALSGTYAASNLSYFGAGPVSINGVSVGAIQDITVTSGIRLIQEGDASEVYDSFTGLEQTEPTIRVRTLHETNWSVLGLNGVALNGTTGIVCFGRKYAPDSTRVANGVAEHIKISSAFGRVRPVDTNGETTSPISDTLVAELRSNTDTGSPLTVATAQAIT